MPLTSRKPSPSSVVLPNPPLPPGSRGLPGIGETLAFASNGFRFVDERVAKYGPIFKTKLLGRNTIVISGPEAAELFLDPDLCLRGRPLANIKTLFGGPSLPMLDGKVHRARKTMVLAGFTGEALREYLPGMQSLVEASAERWSQQGELGLLNELKKLAMEVIFFNVAGARANAKLDQVRDDYRLLQQAFGALPVNFPGTAFNRAIKARDRIFTFYRELIASHRQKNSSDALSRILLSQSDDGQRISDEEAVLELHHIIVAGFIIFCEFADSLLHLAKAPNVLSALQAEVRTSAVAAGPLTLEGLEKLPLLDRVVMETKRLCHILPVIFGAAKKSFVFNGYTVPEGWMLLWGLRSSHLDAAIYRDPLHFDPDRFAAPRAEHTKHECAFVPHGPGPALGHKCPGTDYATLFMKTFLVCLLRKCRWELPPQNFNYEFKIMPPEPKDGLRARVTRI